jgi:hypothetical protein
VPREIYGSLCKVHVHEVVDDPALNVSVVLMNEHLLARVEDLEEAKVGLEGLVKGLVLIFVVTDTLLYQEDR